MSKITLEPNSSGAGTFSIVSPDSNINRTLNLPEESGELLVVDSSGNVGLTIPSSESGDNENGYILSRNNNLIGGVTGSYSTDDNIGRVKVGAFNNTTDTYLTEIYSNNEKAIEINGSNTNVIGTFSVGNRYTQISRGFGNLGAGETRRLFEWVNPSFSRYMEFWVHHFNQDFGRYRIRGYSNWNSIEAVETAGSQLNYTRVGDTSNRETNFLDVTNPRGGSAFTFRATLVFYNRVPSLKAVNETQ